MANELKMPQLSDTMDSGKILAWKKQQGDKLSRGDILAEVETDKANLEIECFQAGSLLKILVPAGQFAKVGETIAVIGAPGEQVDMASIPTTSQRTQMIATSQTERIKASPLARKMAEQGNVDLTLVRGSGPQGRIIKKDIQALANPIVKAPTFIPSTEPSHSAANFTGLSGRTHPLSKMRETIARRMQESVNQSPHFYMTTSIDMQACAKLRQVLKDRPEYNGISINHFVIKASAYALTHEPRVNYSIRDGLVFEPDQINIGIITAVEDGLLIPVLRAVNTLPLKDLVFEARAATERAKAGRPNAQDLSGGTFSISNMGMFDVENFTAIINPGQGAVLAVGSSQEVAVVRNGQVQAALQMKVTLSVDHRIIDGLMAANFLKFFMEGLENPALLMV